MIFLNVLRMSEKFQFFLYKLFFENPVYLMFSEKGCLMTSKTRKNCKKCRFSKCLSVGMKVTWVLSEEERCQRMLQRTKSKPQKVPVLESFINHVEFLLECCNFPTSFYHF